MANLAPPPRILAPLQARLASPGVLTRMRTPESLENAVDCGIIEEVIRPLMSGKEAQIYVVVAGGEEFVAKVYKEAANRTFKHRSEYTEGRRTRNSRDQRAVNKRSRHGRSQDEAGWRSTEADMIRRLCDAGVRVPELMNFVDGVLIMELVKDGEGAPAPRLGDLSFTASEAREVYERLLREVLRMLCAGVIHGDLSEFNVLMGADGPVVIDLPQAIDASSNQGARKFLLRDVENLHRFVSRHSPGHRTLPYGEEMWALYEAGRLEPNTELEGKYLPSERKADTEEVLALIEDADLDEFDRREARGEDPSMDDISLAPLRADAPSNGDEEAPTGRLKSMRTVVDFTQERAPRSRAGKRTDTGRGENAKGRPTRAAAKPVAAKPSPNADEGVTKKRRSRRRRKKSPSTGEARTAETKPRGTGRSTKPTEKTGSNSGSGEASKRRRGTGRSAQRGEAGQSRTAAPGDAQRPTKSASDSRNGNRPPSTGSEGGDRPARRRRRRRPRNTGSSEPT